MHLPLRLITRLVCLSTCLSLTHCQQTHPDSSDAASLITVLRVTSSSPEQPAAEHCEQTGTACVPLAASQKLVARGSVRTFAGGTVSLDFGQGRRVELDSLSQLQLDHHTAKLERGQFSVETLPLIAPEPRNHHSTVPLRVAVADKVFEPDASRPTSALVRVNADDAWLTVRRGQLSGPDPELTAQTGQSLRLTQARAFRTASDGGELPQLLPVTLSSFELGMWQEQPTAQESHGLGAMSARLPGTNQQRQGVRMLRHHAQVHIIDGYAYTQIEEEFENTTPHVLEGQYRFVVPSDAALSRLGLWVGDQLMEGEVLERSRARDIYTSIVDRPVPRDPALLEWENGGTMSLKVFPILPGKTRRLLSAYQQTLSAEGGLLRYVHPLSLGSARGTQIENFSIEITARDRHATLGAPNVRYYEAKTSQTDGQSRVQFSAEHFVPHHDFEVTFARAEGENAQLSTHLTKWDDGEKPFAQPGSSVSAVAPARPLHSDASPSAPEGHFGLRFRVDLPDDSPRPGFTALSRAIVIDTSHSQSKQSIAAQAQLAFGLILEMDPDESFVLLSCDSACESWSSRSVHEQTSSSDPALTPRLARARAFLQQLKPGGASDIAGALATAAIQLEHLDQGQLRTRQLVYMGDGRPSTGELSALGIKTRAWPHLQRAQVELRLIALGHALDQDVLRGLAIELGATLDLVKTGVPLQQRIFELSSALRRPVLIQPELQLPEGLITAESYALPALRLGQELLISGEIMERHAGDVTLTGTLAGRPYRLSKPVAWDTPAHGTPAQPQNPMIPKLWAKSRISLLQSLVPTPQTIAQIIDLSTRYRTMSRYTSFLVLESDAMYDEFGIARPERESSKDETARFIEQSSPEKNEQGFEFLPGGVKSEAPSALADQPIASAEARSSGSHAAAAPLAPGRDELAEGASAAKKSARAEAESTSGRGAPRGPSSDVAPPRSAPAERAASSPPPHRFRRRLPSFHLKTRVADGAWRSWGNERLVGLEQSLNEDPQSRARHEAWIRALVTGGRFVQAQQAAERFFQLDPDSPVAAQLLAFSSVVAEDRERARLLLDVQTEQSPFALALHVQAARAFYAAGDEVRACAHQRSAAALDVDNHQAQLDADRCWQQIAQSSSALPPLPDAAGDPGALQVRVECSAQTPLLDCPSPVVVSPSGEVWSPWTPGLGKTDRTLVTLLRLRSGAYFVLVAGGAPGAAGQLHISGKGTHTVLPFSGGALHTIGRVDVSYD